jgi:hypothetical protein
MLSSVSLGTCTHEPEALREIRAGVELVSYTQSVYARKGLVFTKVA